MTNTPSTITTPIAFRVPNEVFVILKRRADKQGIKVSEYLRKRVVYDTLRKHGGKDVKVG